MGGPSRTGWYRRRDPYAGITLLVISIITLLEAYRTLFLEKLQDQVAKDFGYTFVIMGALCIVMLIRIIHKRGLRDAFKFDPSAIRVLDWTLRLNQMLLGLGLRSGR